MKKQLKEKIAELEHANFVANQHIDQLKEQLRIATEQKTLMERYVISEAGLTSTGK